MKRAVTRGSLLVIAISLILCGLLCAFIFDMRQTREVEGNLIQLVTVMADSFDPDGDHNAEAERLSRLTGGLRVTIVAADGTVTGDSAADYRTLENHADRVEIREARGTRQAVGIRDSATLGQKLMYAVIYTEDGVYIRLAESYDGVLRNLISLMPAMLLSALLAFVAATLFANRFSYSVTRPIVALNDGLTGVVDGSVRLDAGSYPYDELQDMAVKINALSDEVGRRIGELQSEQKKIAYILDNMGEGFMLLDATGRILMINRSAAAYLGCNQQEATGKDILYASRDRGFLDAVNKTTIAKEEASVDLYRDGRVVEVRFTPVGGTLSEYSGGATIIFSDVTDGRSAAVVRREFFSNASHELNTPITSIRGFAELLTSGVELTDAERQEMIGRIADEAGRMSSLIADIIAVSRLESEGGHEAEERERINLAAVIDACCEEVAGLSRQMDVTVVKDVAPGTICAAHKDVYQLVSNLLMNAVKYNVQGGRVDVALAAEGDQVVLRVRNDGDPIPVEHQGRIFERFYRADKGRSRTVGGTGLGLSIVKHVVERMGGTIALESNAEMGTCFTVHLPASQKN